MLTSLAKQASQTSDSRMQALYGVQAAEQGWMASINAATSQAGQLMAGKVDGNLIQLQVSVGASKQKSTSELEQNQVTGSTLTGGRNVAIVSTGANGQNGDIRITGSGVTGNSVTLAAQNDLVLQAATNNSKQTSSDNASGWSVGAHISLGQETGMGAQGSGYAAKGSSDGETTEYVNTRVNAKDSLILSSGRDTVLSGAQALGDKITANVGRDLTLSSLQDTDNYQSKQQSTSGGASFTFGLMTGSASLSMSQSKTQSEYASVGEQSGLFAGNQGYDIFVGDHTQLNGAVIASTADAANNSLNTGTLGWDDIQNKANYSASSAGISGGFSDDNAQRNNVSGVLPVMTNAKGSASGITRSAVADGSITVRDTDQQTQAVSTLSRDTDDANGYIDKIFDKDTIAENQALAQAISQVGVQTMQNVVLQAQVNARSDVLARLSGTPEYNNASPADQQAMLESSPEYVAAEQKYGIGSAFWTAGTALSGALAGLTDGDMSQALAGGLAPYLSLAVKAATTDAEGNVNASENLTGHALAGAVIAYLQGGSVAGGAAGAASGELTAQLIAEELYPGIKPENLTNDQKANVSALSTLSAGLAGGVVGNSAVAAGTGAVAGKTAVENNTLSDLNEFEKDAEELRKKEHEIFGALPDTENPELTHEIVPPGLGIGVGIGVGRGAKGTAAVVLPTGYTQELDGSVIGPGGGVYKVTGVLDDSGNQIYLGGNGNYYTLTGNGSSRIVSPNPSTNIGATGQIGENALKALGGQSQVSFQTSQGVRFVDQLAPGNIAHEAKVGYTSLDASTALQVAKDAELLNRGIVNGVTWNFFTSPVTGLGGPTPALLKALSDVGIKVEVH